MALFILGTEGLFPTVADPKQLKHEFVEFFKERDDEEILSLLEDLCNSSDSADSLEKIFHPIFWNMFVDNFGFTEKPVSVII